MSIVVVTVKSFLEYCETAEICRILLCDCCATKFIMAEAKFIVVFLVQMGKKSYSVIF